MKKAFFTLSSTSLLLLLSVAIIVAQDTCSGFVEQALEAVETSCEGLGRNQACYGYNRVEASFQSEVADDFFTQPSDVSDVIELETLRTAPFNADTNEWGVAVMVLQANMPETLPGQNVTFILMGDTEIENAVSEDEVHTPINGIDVTVSYSQGAAVRSGPGDNFNTIGGVVVGTSFTTDGLSADGNWLRIVWEERPAWIRRTTVEAIAEMDSLPVFNEDLRTPMQAFYLRTGIGQPTCNEIPDNSLLVQGPDDIEIDLTVNGANISLGSSGILRVIETGGRPQLEITVLDGEFVIHADEFNPEDVVIRAGQRSTLCLQDGNNAGVNGQADDLIVNCSATVPENIDTTKFQDDWCALEGVPSTILNYPLDTCTPGNTHTVQSGENLFRIAQFYCISLDELITLNGISNPGQVAVGTVLILPRSVCDGSGSTRPPAGVDDNLDVPVNDSPQACSLSLISPLGNVNSGDHTFSWTAVAIPGVTYNLVFYNFEGQQVETFSTTDTSYTLNLGQQTSTGGEFSWQVQALQNGVLLCESGRSATITRLGDLNPPPPQPFTASVFCVYDSLNYVYEATVTWANAPSGNVVIAWTDTYSSSGTVSGSQSGQATFSTSASPATFNSIIVTSGNDMINLGSC